jgi:hypothetical protein
VIVSSRSRASTPGVDLVWLPLGAGGHSVRLNGRVYEALAARIARRPVNDLYHSALELRLPEGRFVVELAPIPDGNGARRGVVAENPEASCPTASDSALGDELVDLVADRRRRSG